MWVGLLRTLTKHGELGSARSHGPGIIPRFAVIGACLVWVKPMQLQVGPVPVRSPVQQGPVVEPGWRVSSTMNALGTGEGLHLSRPTWGTGRLQSSFLWGTTYHGKPIPIPNLGARPLSMGQGTHQEYFLGMGVPKALQQKVTFWPASRTRDSGCFTR